MRSVILCNKRICMYMYDWCQDIDHVCTGPCPPMLDSALVGNRPASAWSGTTDRGQWPRHILQLNDESRNRKELARAVFMGFHLVRNSHLWVTADWIKSDRWQATSIWLSHLRVSSTTGWWRRPTQHRRNDISPAPEHTDNGSSLSR